MPHLPVETWEQIFSYIHRRERQKTFASCCLVSYAWYDGVVGFLYRCPDLLQGDLPQFLQLVCAPFSNLHSPADDDLGIRKRIRRLDIGNLVHDSSMPSMELLLKATKAHLTEFVSPTVAFRLADIEALEGCTELKELNISRASFRMASASADHPTGIPLTILFHSLSKLPNLARLHLGQCKSDNPRAGSDGTESTDTRPIWPAKLEYLRLSAPIHDQHNQCPIMGECPVKTLRIELDMSPLSRRSTSLSFYGPLFGTNLLSLDFRGTTPKFTTEPLEFFRRYLKNLEHLTIEDSCFRTYLFTALEHIPDVHPLKELVILQGSTHCFCGQLPFDSTHPFDPETLHNFIRDGKLGNLRRVNVNDCIIQFNQINASYWIGRIDVLLTAKELERETGEGAAYIEHEVGIWVA